MIIGYARVSTQDQNPVLQLDALSGAGCEQVFHETATGTLRERPELTVCLRTLRKGDDLVVWKLDRLARSLKDLVEIVHDLNARGVGFRSLTESIDTTSSGGRLVFHIFGALAEFEHSLIRERTIAGLAAARARGLFTLQGLRVISANFNPFVSIMATSFELASSPPEWPLAAVRERRDSGRLTGIRRSVTLLPYGRHDPSVGAVKM